MRLQHDDMKQDFLISNFMSCFDVIVIFFFWLEGASHVATQCKCHLDVCISSISCSYI